MDYLKISGFGNGLTVIWVKSCHGANGRKKHVGIQTPQHTPEIVIESTTPLSLGGPRIALKRTALL
jgi:hypothetical protein